MDHQTSINERARSMTRRTWPKEERKNPQDFWVTAARPTALRTPASGTWPSLALLAYARVNVRGNHAMVYRRFEGGSSVGRPSFPAV